jgi:hypothetical protein
MYLCKQCSEEFYSVVDCNAHREAQHSSSSEEDCVLVQYQCPICGVVYAHKVDCRNHALRDHGVQQAVCLQLES